MSLFSTPDFPITYRPDLGILVGRWMVEISRTEEIKQNYLHMFEAAEECQCRFWLMDARRRFRTTAEITSWVNENVPRLSQGRFGGELRVAFLLAPHQLLVSTDSPPFPELVHPVAGHPMSVQFTDEGEAIAWLRAQM
ncbi:hypothetical protein [Hymenobacter pini]|uniref:hypothetical protein n=1 Tax=Hymenobacter pini TaxID=2880879 RepID=UPI001CF4CCD7|nr:hypothetical protein [Hymenobacter pini]MCA8832487.1 hypothetical protein [Hymenobacter pini]